MGDHLKDSIKDYYHGFNLSEAQLAELRSRLSHSEEPSKGSWMRPHWLIPAACGFAAALILALSFYFNSLKPLYERIADEVAYNHNKAMPSEVLTRDYNILNEALDRLDFEAKPSTQLARGFQLVGGRYCSVQGKIAAQLHMVDTTNDQQYTLYQFYAAELKELSQAQQSFQMDGTIVKIWKEGDLGFALAHSVSGP